MNPLTKKWWGDSLVTNPNWMSFWDIQFILWAKCSIVLVNGWYLFRFSKVWKHSGHLMSSFDEKHDKTHDINVRTEMLYITQGRVSPLIWMGIVRFMAQILVRSRKILISLYGTYWYNLVGIATAGWFCANIQKAN